MADGTSEARGDIYEVRCCMLLALLGFIKKEKDFCLRYQVKEKESGKFDDILFFDGKTLLLLQLKHLEKPEKKGNKITRTDLFSNTYKDDYNLLKYVISVHKNIKKSSAKNFVASVFTNAGFDIDENNEMTLNYFRNKLKDLVKDIPKIKLNPVDLDKNSVLCDFSNLKCFKFEDANIAKILKCQAEIEVDKLSKPSQKKKQKLDKETLIETLEKLSEDDIKSALEHIIYAVEAPNDLKVEEIIKENMKNLFQLNSDDALYVYNTLEKAFKEWCDHKTKIHPNQSDKNKISFDDLKEFFENNVKKFSYHGTAPTSLFVGRKEQLDEIRDKFKKYFEIIICGLVKVGKSAFTRKFITQYGQTDFYGRVIWIQAESEQTVKSSFSSLAKKLKIKDKNPIKAIINDVFEYLRGLKVLFVFDNYDSSTTETETVGDSENDLVSYCRELASAPNKSDRPYFIFTSRNRECFLDVISIDLGTLTDEEACELIKMKLADKKVSDDDVSNLAKAVGNFPLSLQQATDCINRKQKVRKQTGGTYGIEDYLCDLQKEEIKNYRHRNYFNKYQGTSY